MNYSGLHYPDMLNGPGLRVTLFVSGCSNNCPDCQNPETHDPLYGNVFTNETMKEIVSVLSEGYISGLTFCGGDPLYHSNITPVCDIARTIRAVFGDTKNIWLYSGYTLEEIKKIENPDIEELFDYVDVLLEGRYISKLRSPDKPWVGSSNQRIFSIDHSNREFKEMI